MSKGTCSFTVKNGVPSAVTVTDGTLPDGDFVIGWGLSDKEETLVAMLGAQDGKTTLCARASLFMTHAKGALVNMRKIG